MRTQKDSEPLLGEQMQVKQSKGESNKPFISSVVWMAPAASRWLSPPASALLNIHTYIYNNHSCSHTHTAKPAWSYSERVGFFMEISCRTSPEPGNT